MVSWSRNEMEQKWTKGVLARRSLSRYIAAFEYAEEYDNETELYLIVNQNQIDEMSKG